MANTVSGAEAFVDAKPYDKHASEWSIDISSDTYEDTNWTAWQQNPDSEGWRTYVPGLKDWSGSLTTFADDSPGSTLLPRGPIPIWFYTVYDPDTPTYLGYYGEVIITGVSPSAAIDDMQSNDIDFQGTGALEVGDIGAGGTTTT